ncbi:hypothetical protein [Bosea sp. (in: a-proteobacteria)]|uniref:hypothetical protein n=1 Tax=Bosea sp. (in: a-proteobacteria) TaxID=1871050 RepID=UPI002733057E|nr:hypothetical protein [Bosea sp. (in: a-proteobacteria)]MDP3407225.1 hypothetical protein [Bosea sp. (in: a-proteobacteria)]
MKGFLRAALAAALLCLAVFPFHPASAAPGQVVTRFMGAEREILEPVAATPTIAWAPQLLFPPGFYSHNGLVYDLTRPGHYVFFNPMVNTTRMTVAAGDPVALLSAAAWLTTFGDNDERLAGESLPAFVARASTKARTSKLRLLCGNTIEFTAGALLAGSGVPHRTVRFLTMEAPNNHVDGHIAVEVMIAGQWVLADVSLNTMFRDAGGARLSARDAIPAIAADAFAYELLASDGYAVETAGAYGFDATGYAEALLLTDADRRAWHRRIFQAVGVDRLDGDGITRTYWKLPAGSENRGAWLESLSPGVWKVTDPVIWDTVFYP